MRNALFATAALLSTSVMAHNDECSVDMTMGVDLTPTKIELLVDEKSPVVMTADRLYVDGSALELSSEQQDAYQAYQQGIREFVPQVVDLAVDAVEVAMIAVQEVIKGLNINDDGQRELEESIEQLKETQEKYFSKEEQTYHLAAHNNGEFDEELEQGISRVVENSVEQGLGSVFSMLGEAFSSSDGSFEERMEAFGKRMEKMGEAIEQKVEASAESIEQRGDLVCEQAEQLHKLELEAHRQIPQLQDYSLLKI
ncbi:hypothetical protein GCM10011369_21830 [Neiella marina]|uniref:DUF2884 family protein n=1 Tax=Neiella marina TaxID=508461 RepID=A0A8J2U5N9_9GAMM|nr:DUF2884 family protein [Neiella marina]GGA79503.1 hypothetical protein GCM10011369_21830 [Neiella marina]